MANSATADDAYIRSLFSGHRSAVLAYATHLAGGDRQRAEDLVQEAFIRAWRSAPRLPAGAQRAWLRRTVYHLAVDAYRSRRGKAVAAGPAEMEAIPAADDLDRAVESWDLAAALSALSPEHRQVLTQIYYRGCSAAQAAAALGIPTGTAKSRAFYALKALKTALEQRQISL